MLAALIYMVVVPKLVPLHVIKISQVIGEHDRERNVPADNRTESRYGLYGTDLGASFEHEGRMVFLFGDTWAVDGKYTEDRPVDGDAIAWSNDKDPDDGLTLDFVTASDGKYKAVQIPGVSLKGFEVPNGGFSLDGYMYGIYTTDAKVSPTDTVMGRSVLARSKDAKDWSLVYSLSRNKFINVAPWVVDAAKHPGLPVKTGKAVLFWASGTEYRRSNPHLACIPASEITNHQAIQYWNGGRWSHSESEAKPLFEDPTIGELSVAWCDPLKKWIMLYNTGNPRGIVFRVAEKPWGPWTDSKVLFDAQTGYGKFMHISYKDKRVDNVQDPWRPDEYGGEYGPYMIPRFFKKIPNGARIYFLMSTWNPYTVVLMRADLVWQ